MPVCWRRNMSKRETVVELINIHKTYLLGIEGVPALRGVSLKVAKGDWLIIYGNSGGGKSSLLNCIGTIDRPTKGELKICSTVVNSATSDEVLAYLRLNKMGFVFQTFNLLGNMTALENVMLPMELRGQLSIGERKIKATESLSSMGLGARLHHYPNQMSGGEMQRTTIAPAISNDPQILLLDEPTGDLDSANTLKVVDLLVRLNRDSNMTMIMVTHDVYLKNFATKVVTLRDGKIAKEEEIPVEARNAAILELKTKLEGVPCAHIAHSRDGGQGACGHHTGLEDGPQGPYRLPDILKEHRSAAQEREGAPRAGQPSISGRSGITDRPDTPEQCTKVTAGRASPGGAAWPGRAVTGAVPDTAASPAIRALTPSGEPQDQCHILMCL